MLKNLVNRLLLSLGILTLPTVAARAAEETNCAEDSYRVGAAQSDITGAIAGIGMMGYAELSQIAEGLHMRLRSRTLIVSDSCKKETLALVVGDLGQVFGGLKDAVLKQLDQELPGVFSHENLLFSATHTHSGPGGFAHHALYNITTFGFHPQNFNLIVDGTVRSVVQAYRQQEPAQLEVSRTHVPALQFNRSLEAYAMNPADERARYAATTDGEMLMLAARSKAGKPIAAFNWFAVHPVSIPLSNRLVSGDNKGLASYLFEKKMGTSYRKDREFVAGFLQANSGDVSPYDVTQPENPNEDFWLRNELAAQGQLAAAEMLFESSGEPLRGPLAAVHKFTDLAQRRVDSLYTAGAGVQATCQGSLGVSFGAGTENGRPFPIFKEGTIWGQNWPKITLLPEEQDCQSEKVILLPTGLVKPDPWTARVAPFQIFRIGQLAIVAAPFEMTTMAGRRLKEHLQQTLASSGVRYVALTTLANDYLHYVTTREEYSAQAYEGGSNLYGPWSLAAYTEIFDELSVPLAQGLSAVDEASPLDLTQKQLVLEAPIPADTTPAGKEFGGLIEDSEEAYAKGETVRVLFWGAHPHNSLAARQETLLRVEEKTGDSWQVIRRDWDPDTFYQWKRKGFSASEVAIEWRTNSEVRSGIYRICHEGRKKKQTLLTSSLKPYEGCSRAFNLQ